MDHICTTGEKTQHFPHEKSPPYPGHILARQSDQRRGEILHGEKIIFEISHAYGLKDEVRRANNCVNISQKTIERKIS